MKYTDESAHEILQRDSKKKKKKTNAKENWSVKL